MEKKITENKDTTPKELDIEEELEKYKGMVDKGLISEDDYNLKKKELLNL